MTNPATELAVEALDWLLSSAVPTETGLAWTGIPDEDEFLFDLYQGASGIVISLLEGYRDLGDERYATAALRGARTIATAVPEETECGLYRGLAGMAFALRAVGDACGDTELNAAADHALARVRSAFDGDRFGDPVDLIGGNSGIALAALAVGDVELAELAVTPLLRTAETTSHGVQWQHRRNAVTRMHHISHGTLGMVYALAAVGEATGRDELVDMALLGVSDVVSRDEDGPDGFLVPHSDPQAFPERVPRYSYGWCHGSAGDAQVFRLLGRVTKDPAWSALADRCWHTVTHSGLPQRLSPGFWDNSGRCCGTAGVLAFASDRQVEHGDGLEFARVLVADIAERAIVDSAGARWSNHEHRDTPSDLSPRRGWAMGNAGISRELLRFARISDGGAPGYAVTWPDHPAT